MSEYWIEGLIGAGVTVFFFSQWWFPIFRIERPHRRLLQRLARSRGVSVQRLRNKCCPRLIELNMGGCRITATFEYTLNTQGSLWRHEFVVRAHALRSLPGFEASVGWHDPTQPELDVCFDAPHPERHPELHAQAVAAWSPRARHLAAALRTWGGNKIRSEQGQITLAGYGTRKLDHADTAIQLVAELAGAEVVAPLPRARVVDA